MSRICVYLGSRGQHYILPSRPYACTVSMRAHLGMRRRTRRADGGTGQCGTKRGWQRHGVMPDHLVEREQAHFGLSELIRVPNMHERKATMAANADAFIALPGGIGTFEELFEIWTWGYLGLHDKPMGLLDTDGFYAPLLAFLDSTVSHGFLAQATRDMLLDAPTPSQLLDALEAELS